MMGIWAFYTSLLFLWNGAMGDEKCCEDAKQYEEYMSASLSHVNASAIPYLVAEDAKQSAIVPRSVFKIKSLWDGQAVSVQILGRYQHALILDPSTAQKHRTLQNGEGWSFLKAADGQTFYIRFHLMDASRSYTFGFDAACRVHDAEVVSWLVMPGTAGLLAATLLRSKERAKIYHFTQSIDKLPGRKGKGIDTKEQVIIPVSLFQPCGSCSISPPIPSTMAAFTLAPSPNDTVYLDPFRPELVHPPRHHHDMNGHV